MLLLPFFRRHTGWKHFQNIVLSSVLWHYTRKYIAILLQLICRFYFLSYYSHKHFQNNMQMQFSNYIGVVNFDTLQIIEQEIMSFFTKIQANITSCFFVKSKKRKSDQSRRAIFNWKCRVVSRVHCTYVKLTAKWVLYENPWMATTCRK